MLSFWMAFGLPCLSCTSSSVFLNVNRRIMMIPWTSIAVSRPSLSEAQRKNHSHCQGHQFKPVFRRIGTFSDYAVAAAQSHIVLSRISPVQRDSYLACDFLNMHVVQYSRVVGGWSAFSPTYPALLVFSRLLFLDVPSRLQF